MADVVIQAQSTLFNREGDTWQRKQYEGSSALASLMGNIALNTQVLSSLTSAERIALAVLFATTYSTIIPGGQTLYNLQAEDSGDPKQFTGAAALQSIYELDPFGTDYETETEDLYERSYLIARAAAISGPLNVRGATTRQAFELAELDTRMSINRFREIWQNQMSMAQVVTQAVQVANTAEAERRNALLRAQQQQAATEQGRSVQMLQAAEQLNNDINTHIRTLSLGGEFLTVPTMWTHEQLQGQGFQGGATTSFGMSTWR